nr:MAG TPA: hypothetical protein [Bacteriophage sp.]
MRTIIMIKNYPQSFVRNGKLSFLIFTMETSNC